VDAARILRAPRGARGAAAVVVVDRGHGAPALPERAAAEADFDEQIAALDDRAIAALAEIAT